MPRPITTAELRPDQIVAANGSRWRVDVRLGGNPGRGGAALTRFLSSSICFGQQPRTTSVLAETVFLQFDGELFVDQAGRTVEVCLLERPLDN